MKPKRYIEFKIETAENMDKNKVVLLSHPDNTIMLSRLMYRIEDILRNYPSEE